MDTEARQYLVTQLILSWISMSSSLAIAARRACLGLRMCRYDRYRRSSVYQGWCLLVRRTAAQSY